MLGKGVHACVSETNFQRYLMIVQSTGIIAASLSRSKSVLDFGYALFLLLRSREIAPAICEKVVRRWLVLSILTGRYSASPETNLDADIKHFQDSDPMVFLEQTEAGELADAFWENLLIDRLKTASNTSPCFRVFQMPQVKLGDCGFLSEHITVKSLIEQRGDFHHIFPRKYLQRNGFNSRDTCNQVANLVYTQSEINIGIRDQAPKACMHKVLAQCNAGQLQYGGITSEEKLSENLRMNCIPGDIIDMEVPDYEGFLERHRWLMAAKIRSYYLSLR